MDRSERVARLRALMALEIARIVDDLALRRDFLMRTWGRFRDRTPFLETVYNRYRSVGFPDLVDLETDEVLVIEAFFRKIDEFRLYVSYTQDMPTTMGDRYDLAVEQLRVLGEHAVEVLGGAPESPVILDNDSREAFLLGLPPAEETAVVTEVDESLVGGSLSGSDTSEE